MSLQESLAIVQTVAIAVLWLFFIGRWVGTHDRRGASPPSSSMSLNQTARPASSLNCEHRIKGLEDEHERTRDRLHKLEGFKQSTEASIRYIEREIDRLDRRERSS